MLNPRRSGFGCVPGYYEASKHSSNVENVQPSRVSQAVYDLHILDSMPNECRCYTWGWTHDKQSRLGMRFLLLDVMCERVGSAASNGFFCDIDGTHVCGHMNSFATNVEKFIFSSCSHVTFYQYKLLLLRHSWLCALNRVQPAMPPPLCLYQTCFPIRSVERLNIGLSKTVCGRSRL